MTVIGVVRRSLRATLEMALPTTCGGCGAPGATWCALCARETILAAYAGGPRRVSPTPCPVGYPPTWAATPYDAAARAALVAFKDGDRRDLKTVLAPMLSDGLAAALAADPGLRTVLTSGNGPVFVVPFRRPPARGRAAGAVDPCCRGEDGSLRGRAHRLAGVEASAPGCRSGGARPQTTSHQP